MATAFAKGFGLRLNWVSSLTRMTALLALMFALTSAAPTNFGKDSTPVLGEPPQWTTVLMGITLVLFGLYICFLGTSASFLSFEPVDGYSQRLATYVGIWVGTGLAGGIISSFLPSFTGTLGAVYYGFMFFGLWFCSLSTVSLTILP
ncbi:hypothetical protein BC829DRAFT_399746 [Chytridium lagenaria]|nr:hypothetical protein BC829DRAFT_399746 [Chytridium lagenaria]